jgi:hypothetical protein
VADRIDLKIFHYHFLTGGVATVIQQALRAFHAHLPEIRSIELVAGRMPEGIRHAISRYDGKSTVVPEIDYRDPGKGDKKETAEEAGKLAQQLLDSFGSDDSVWWVHNFHLGKNTVFTQALLQIIYSGQPQRIILQIHDFPECGRFQNLRHLRNTLTLDPYPLNPWVRYAVLNQRDRNILIQAGVPTQAVFLLENPVFLDRVPEQRNSVRDTLKRSFGKSFPRYDPQAPLLFYPSRTIRRKNAMEAVLLCLLIEVPANILITLPGISAPEKSYSEIVEKIFADGLCPGLWGIGTSLERQNLSFEDLVTGCDLVLSTSVQEGFGYLFINSLLWSLPLVARDLDILEGLKDLFAEYPAYFYERILVPFAKGPYLRNAYRRKILSLSDLLPEEEKQRLLGSAETLMQDGLVDFSYLPVAEQDRFLRELSVSDKLGISRRENGRTLAQLQTLLATKHGGRGSGWSENLQFEVRQRFGAAAYAEGFRSLIASFGTHPASCAEPSGGGDSGRSIQEAVLKAFLKIEHLRLLYD